MKTLVAIPSKNRADILAKNAWQWIQYLPLDWKIFVEPQDYNLYCYRFGSECVVQLPDNNQGLGYAKNFIKNYALQNNYSHIYKMDDDVKGFTKMRTTLKDPQEIAKQFMENHILFTNYFEKFPSLGAISFPYSNELYDLSQKFVKTKRIQTAYYVKTEFFAVDPAINVFEDFATGINILRNNQIIMKYCYSGIQLGIKVGGGTGGHQDYDRKIQAYKEVELLRNIYPPLRFKPVNKPWQIEPDIRSIKL